MIHGHSQWLVHPVPNRIWRRKTSWGEEGLKDVCWSRAVGRLIFTSSHELQQAAPASPLQTVC
jgi:hypothetical protein